MEIINIEDDVDAFIEIINIEDDDDELNYGDGEFWSRGRLLGEGSYGAVFVGNTKDRPDYPSKIAVKSAEMKLAETLRLERSIMSHFSGCSSIIQCFGTEMTHRSDGKLIYNLLLEYCSGGTLGDRIRNTRSKGLPEMEARQYTRSLVEGIIRIHDEGFVHCDLKPDNILLCPTKGDEFVAKICDFGLTKLAKEDRQRRKSDRAWHGTPWYLAPEALREMVQETPTDIWALGIIVLEMLTGKPAWDLEQGTGTEAEKVIRQIQKTSSIPKLPAGLSRDAKGFLQSCLRRTPKCRGTAKWLLRHPFISGIRVGPRSLPETGIDLTRPCVQPSQLNAEQIPKIRIRFA